MYEALIGRVSLRHLLHLHLKGLAKLYEALPYSLRWRLVWPMLHELKVEASVAQD